MACATLFRFVRSVEGAVALLVPAAWLAQRLQKLPTMARLYLAAVFLVLVLRSALVSQVEPHVDVAPNQAPNVTLVSPMRVAHVTTTAWSARQFSLDTILGQPAHTWTRRLDDGAALDGAVFEVADAQTALHHIYVVHVVPRVEP